MCITLCLSMASLGAPSRSRTGTTCGGGLKIPRDVSQSLEYSNTSNPRSNRLTQFRRIRLATQIRRQRPRLQHLLNR